MLLYVRQWIILKHNRQIDFCYYHHHRHRHRHHLHLLTHYYTLDTFLRFHEYVFQVQTLKVLFIRDILCTQIYHESDVPYVLINLEKNFCVYLYFSCFFNKIKRCILRNISRYNINCVQHSILVIYRSINFIHMAVKAL